jgi:hypothetical protein
VRRPRTRRCLLKRCEQRFRPQQSATICIRLPQPHVIGQPCSGEPANALAARAEMNSGAAIAEEYAWPTRGGPRGSRKARPYPTMNIRARGLQPGYSRDTPHGGAP